MISSVMLIPRYLKLMTYGRAKPCCADLHIHYQFKTTPSCARDGLPPEQPSSKRAAVTSPQPQPARDDALPLKQVCLFCCETHLLSVLETTEKGDFKSLCVLLSVLL